MAGFPESVPSEERRAFIGIGQTDSALIELYAYLK
jgi:hypothetical protein